MTRDAILTVDLGGSGLKAGLFSGDGTLLAAAGRPLGFADGADGVSEADPQDWWRALGEALGTIAAEAGAAFDRVGGIAICGFTRTQVLLGADGAVLRPAIGFRDTRAQALVAAALARPEVAEHAAAKAFNPYHPLARLAWVKAQEPAVWAATRVVLEPKDWLAFRLTGALASDPVSQHWLIEATTGETASLAARLGLAVPLPPLVPPTATVGRVRPRGDATIDRLAGVPVVCGANDTFAAVAGLGAMAAGRAYVISGSSEVVGLLTDRPAEAPGLATLPWGERLWHVGGPGLNGTTVLDWIVETLDPSPRPLAVRLDALLARPASPAPLIFLPQLSGERTPWWNPDLRAAFLGLEASHGPGDLVRAVMAGIAFHDREVLERAETATGVRPAEIRLGGGGAANATWNRLRAEILGRDVVAVPQSQTGLSGCRAMARVGLGLAADLGAALEGSADGFERVRPDEAAVARWDRLRPIVAEAQRQTAALSARLAAFDRNAVSGATDAVGA